MGLPNDSRINLYKKWASGPKNKISDVDGVIVGHVTLQNREINTGVTAILPHGGNLFQEKVMAGVSVINGFGKSVGLLQVEELGTIETPILMTNTFSVGTVSQGLIRYMLEKNEDIGVTTGTVNPIVTECNDGRLNDIRAMAVQANDARLAIENATADFAEGGVGAGTGMICMGLKGGIGSASRVIELQEKPFTIGSLCLSNFGSIGNLVVGGKPLGRKIKEEIETKDQGSIIIVLATDLPLNERQLKRMAKRSMISLGRVGSYCGNGSGDIAIAFSTANHISHYSEEKVLEMKMLHDDCMDVVFAATVECVEEAIISSLYHGKTTKGVRGNEYNGLQEYLYLMDSL